MISLTGTCEHWFGNLKMVLNDASLQRGLPSNLHAAFNLTHYQGYQEGYNEKGYPA
jgi:hypothetical protein